VRSLNMIVFNDHTKSCYSWRPWCSMITQNRVIFEGHGVQFDREQIVDKSNTKCGIISISKRFVHNHYASNIQSLHSVFNYLSMVFRQIVRWLHTVCIRSYTMWTVFLSFILNYFKFLNYINLSLPISFLLLIEYTIWNIVHFKERFLP
jgi:hypothetical protein